MKTFIPKDDDINRKWWVIDAENVKLGRLATQVAGILRGKHQPIYTPHVDTGDFVVIVNADKVALSGHKVEYESYFRHSTHPGGWTLTPLREAIVDRPEWVVRRTIWGMLPHNALGRKMIRKLKVYRTSEHPHSAQQPQEWNPLSGRMINETTAPIRSES